MPALYPVALSTHVRAVSMRHYASVLFASATMLLSPAAGFAQFVQQGPKLIGTGVAEFSYQGIAVALSADGHTAIVGGATDNSSMGAAWVFTRTGATWTQQGSKLVGSGAIGTQVMQGA